MSRTQPPTRSFSTRDDIEPPGGEGTPRRGSAESDAAREIARGYWRAAKLLTREGNSSLDVLDKRDVLDDQQGWAVIAAALDGKQRPRTRQLRERQGQIARWRTPSFAGIAAMTSVLLLIGAAGATVLVRNVVRDARRDFLPHITAEPPRRGAVENPEPVPSAAQPSQPSALPEALAPTPEAAQHNPRLRPGATTSEPGVFGPSPPVTRIELPDALPPIGELVAPPPAPLPVLDGGLRPVLEDVLGIPRGLLKRLEKQLGRGRSDRAQQGPKERADEARSEKREPRRSPRTYRIEIVAEENLVEALAPSVREPSLDQAEEMTPAAVSVDSPPPADPPAGDECKESPVSEAPLDTPSQPRSLARCTRSAKADRQGAAANRE